MQIQLNTDTHVQGDDALAQWVDRELQDKLSRFAEHITRIEVHLRDTNAGHQTEDDKRCVLEARIAGRQPVAVTHDASKIADALHGAADKLSRSLDTTLGRQRAARRRGGVAVEPIEPAIE
jgi:ribosome-associated translation inhibitor RaiA